MLAWHPLTKIVLVLGVLALAGLWWTGENAESAAVVAVRAPDQPTPLPSTMVPLPRPGGDPHPRVLPSIEMFAGMLERPLFTATRRPDGEGVEWELTAAPAESSAEPLARPEVRFIGSVEERGRVRALVSDGLAVRGLLAGETIDGWEVLVIEPRRLVLGQDDERIELKILE